jgi:hypothetical protein
MWRKSPGRGNPPRAPVSRPTPAGSGQFGQSIAPADIAPWDISIGPDGAGLPPGRGTAAQGESVYATQCQGCHGEKGAGGPNDALVGGIGSLVPDKGSHFENRRRPRQWQASARWHIAEKFSIAVPSTAGGRGRGQCAPPTSELATASSNRHSAPCEIIRLVWYRHHK